MWPGTGDEMLERIANQAIANARGEESGEDEGADGEAPFPRQDEQPEDHEWRPKVERGDRGHESIQGWTRPLLVDEQK